MKKLKYPPILQWEVTPLCNHNCLHCYNYWRKDCEIYNTINNHIEIANKIVDNHPAAVVITGGEPLIVFDKIKDAIQILLNNNISVSVNTNAVLVTEEIAQFMHNNNMSAFVSLPCSDSEICDYITNSKNSLNAISIGIQTLIKNKVKVAVNMVVSKINFDYIYSTAKYAKEVLKVDTFFASRVSKPINSDSTFIKHLLSKEEITCMENELIKIQKNLNMRVGTAGSIPACSITSDEVFQLCAYTRTCTAGKTSYAIDSNGNIKACPRDVKIYGNILTGDFSEIWNRMEEWRDDSLLPDECKKCNVKNMCKGGCRLDALPLTGKRDSLDPIANINVLPIKFKKEHKDFIVNEEQIIYVPPIIKFIKEDFAWRVNFVTSTMYITDELKEFLSNHNEFVIKEFMDTYNVDFNSAKQVINLLIENNILYIHKSSIK